MKKELRRKIVDLLTDFDWMFGTSVMDRKLVYMEDDEDGKVAEVTIHEEYQQITIRVYPCFFNHSLKEQRKALLHEFCHVISAPSRLAMFDMKDGKLITEDQIKFINEKETSRIECILDLLLQGKLTFARKAYQKYIYENRSTNKGHIRKRVLARKKV